MGSVRIMLISDIKIIPNYASDEDINNAINLFNNSKTYKFKNNPLVKIIPLREGEKEATALIKKYSNKLLLEQPVSPLFISEGFLSHWETGAFAGVHIDNHGPRNRDDMYGVVNYTALIYLNDDYEGGEIYFPNLNFEYKPKRGDAISFPCDLEDSAHGVKEVTKGNRYTIAIWYCLEKEKSNPLLS